MDNLDQTYTINRVPEDNKIIISGQLALQTVTNYNEIIEFLLGSIDDSDKDVILDISNLTILNSSGIASFALFIIKMRETEKKLIIYASRYIQWQVYNLEAFKELNSNVFIEYITVH